MRGEGDGSVCLALSERVDDCTHAYVGEYGRRGANCRFAVESRSTVPPATLTRTCRRALHRYCFHVAFDRVLHMRSSSITD